MTAPEAGPPASSRTPVARRRLTEAMATVIADKGYPAVTVADVVRVARTSRRTFYEHFVSRDDCYQAMLADFTGRQIRHIMRSVDLSRPWPEQVRQAVGAWLSGAETQPEITLSWIRDSPALPAARVAQVGAQHDIIEMIRSLASGPQFRREHGPPTTEVLTVLVGGLRELIASQVEAGRPLSDLVDVATTVTTALLSLPPEPPQRS